MQETVSEYKFGIFHHYTGGRARGRQAVVQLAARGSMPLPGPGFLEDQGPFPRRRVGSAPGSPGPGSGTVENSPAHRRPSATRLGPLCPLRKAASTRRKAFPSCKRVNEFPEFCEPLQQISGT